MINGKNSLAWAAAIITPLAYLALYTPYGLDTTDTGYFYAYAWRIINGQMPYRDFWYIKPGLPLYWHAMWMRLTPETWQVLAGKAGFLAEMLAAAWGGALFLGRFFSLERLRLPLPLLAVTGFVYGIHSFPHVPWHTADGVFFCSLSLCASAYGWPFMAGFLAGCALLCKQSFLLFPLGLLILLWIWKVRLSDCAKCGLGLLLALLLAWGWIGFNGAWEQFRAMTTGQLAIGEALEAGILIYLRQNWALPVLAVAPCLLLRVIMRKKLPLQAICYAYLVIMGSWHIHQVYVQKTWTGYGASWPTLFLLLGACCVLWPGSFLKNWSNRPQWTCAAALGACLLIAWSAAISGGYKIPAFYAVPLVFSFFLVHARLGGNAGHLAWAAFFCGLIIFWAGWQYPYVFPARPVTLAEMRHDAGQIFSKATGVKVDADMLERLSEFKELRKRYGPAYKTLPAFSFAYYLNGDKPVYGSDWLIDWEINGEVDKLYQELLDKRLTVFMERDQADTPQADAYARAGYGVPQKVRKNWRIIEETPHFLVFQPPEAKASKIPAED